MPSTTLAQPSWMSVSMPLACAARWISADDPAELQRFINSHRADIAHDLDNDPVFLAQNTFSLSYEAERWKAIRFAAIKDYQVRDKAA